MSKKFLVRYKNETFDITKFVDKHPGGRETLMTASNSDIDFKFDVAVPHSAAAKYLLNEYRVSTQCNNNVKNYDEKATHHLMQTDESMEVVYGVDLY